MTPSEFGVSMRDGGRLAPSSSRDLSRHQLALAGAPERSVMRRIVGILASLVLLVPGIVVSATSSLAASGTAVVFIGTISMTPSAGESSASVPTATLLVVPDSQFQDAALAANQPIQALEIAAVPVAAGSYSLSLDTATLSPDYVADDGHIEVMIAASAGGKALTWEVPVQAGQVGTVAIPALDMGNAVVVPTAGAAVPVCGTIVWGAYNGPYVTKILDVFAKGKVQGTGTYMYGSNTSTTLGMLAQSPGGAWQAGGTYTESRSSSTGFSTPAKDKRLSALWRYRERGIVCYGNQNVPYNYAGKGTDVSVAHRNFSYCGGTYRSGARYFRNSSANQTYSTGLTVYGIGLSSQAGLSTSMSLAFNFNSAGNVCGNTGLAEQAPIVEASTF